MIAQVGDRIVLEGTHQSGIRRIGVIISVSNDDGAPPYRVRWLDTGRISLIFPGAEARIEHQPVHASAAPVSGGTAGG